MSEQEKRNLYVLLDSRNAPLARGVLESPQNEQNWQVLILDDKISEVMRHEQLQLLPMGDSGESLLGKVVRNRGDRIVVEKLQKLDSEMRQNLRMPTHFHTLMYPITGQWKGRRELEVNDLSCGGLSFFCKDQLEEGERVEIVIPITTFPVILRCQVLRTRPSDREELLYAAKFVDMCNDEEVMVREAVFSVQVNSRPRSN